MTPSVDELLFMWEERRAGGELVSAADLCADCPTLAAELEERIRLLQGVDQLLTVDQSAAETEPDLQPLPGTIAGYEVRQVLGRGGEGVVYRVWGPVLKCSR